MPNARTFEIASRTLFGVLAGSLLPASGVYADQLIRIPTADRVTAPKAEYLFRAEGNNEGYGTLLVPAGLAYELALRYYNKEDGDTNFEGGGQFQLLPDGVITPGISVGMWDVTNSTRVGRRAFLVVTKSLREGQFFVRKPIERMQFTLGAGTGRLGGVFAGLRIDLPARFALVGEYDSRRLNAGVWFTPIEQVTLKAELQNGNPYLGGALNFRF